MTVEIPPSLPQTATAQNLSPANSITSLAQGSMFWRPAFLEDSNWLEHIPFAFWLIEAHKPSKIVELGIREGVSYFAMCQAVDRLQLDTSCFAVSTWENGHIDTTTESDLYTKVKHHNEAHYSSFSSLLKSTSEQTLEHFADHSIDLIHFDALRGHDASQRLIDSWLPKLSGKGLILIHDTNVREKGVHIHRLFAELKQSYPAFEFRHGHGLGVLGVGENQSELIKILFGHATSSNNNQVFQDVFSRLGRACADSFYARVSEQNAADLARDAEQLHSELEKVEEVLSATRRTLKKKNDEMGRLQSRIRQQVETHALERGQLIERSSMIHTLYDELKKSSKKLQLSVDETSDQLGRQSIELAHIESEKTLSNKEIQMFKGEQQRLQQLLSEKHQRNIAIQQQLENTKQKLAIKREQTQEQLTAFEEEMKLAKHNLSKRTKEREAEKQDLLTELNEQKEIARLAQQKLISTREKLTAEHERLRNSFEQENQQRIDSIIAENNEQNDKELQVLKAEEHRLQQLLKNTKQQLTKELAQTQAQLDTAKGKMKAARQSVYAATRQREIEKQGLHQELKKLKEFASNAQQKLISTREKLTAENKHLRNSFEQENQQRIDSIVAENKVQLEYLHTALESEKTKNASLVDSGAARVAELTQELDTQKNSVSQRFKEIAALTSLLESKEKERQAKLESLEHAKNHLQSQLNIKSAELKQQSTQLGHQLFHLRARISDLYNLRGVRRIVSRKEKEHFQLIMKSDLFDAKWYSAQYLDSKPIMELHKNPARHFTLVGGFEGKNPSERFDTIWYLAQNPDVAKNGANPLLHYILYGKAEGRLAKPPSEQA